MIPAFPPLVRAGGRFLWRNGLLLGLGGVVVYLLWFTWLPLWRSASALEGTPVSHLTVQDEHGRAVSLAEFRGGPVILNFWASWCLPCRVEMPLLAAAHPELAAEGKQLLGINLRESWSTINRFRQEFEVPYPVYRDSGTLAEALGIRVIPALVVLTPEGRVRTIIHGFRPWVRWYLLWWV